MSHSTPASGSCRRTAARHLLPLALACLAFPVQAQAPFDSMGGANRFSLSPQDQAAQHEARGQRHLAKARELAVKAKTDPRAAAKADKEYDRAKKAFGDALVKDPGLAPAHLGLGEVALEQELWSEAATSCQVAVQLTPGRPEPRACLLQALLSLGDMATAGALYRATATTYPQSLQALAEAIQAWRTANPADPRGQEVEGWLAKATPPATPSAPSGSGTERRRSAG